jgi:electron transport complex protein RnfC
MKKVYSFPRGGMIYEDSTVPVNTESVVAFLPTLSLIPMIQHSGSAARPIVSVGETVTEGKLIGRASGLDSSNVHATLPGRIIRSVKWQMSDGRTNEALVIRLEGSFERLGKRQEIFSWNGLPDYEIRRNLASYGIVEMEGSGRPIIDMIHEVQNPKEPISLVVRCVFDDPWLIADKVLCHERMAHVVEGAAITAKASGAAQIIFAVSEGEEELGNRFLEEAAQYGFPVNMIVVGKKYPQRNRRELDAALKEYEKKENIPIGIIFPLGPATLAAVHDAIKFKKPILERYVAIGGSAVKHPQVMRVRVGTRIGEIFAECGGFVDEPKRIASGSPLMGSVVVDLDEPVTKTTYAFFAFLERQSRVGKMRNCISCGECRSVCPVRLDPEELYKIDCSGKINEKAIKKAKQCHACGCCDINCPSSIPLSIAIQNLALKEDIHGRNIS